MSAMDIDREVFADLQASAGAEFVADLVETFAQESGQALLELRRALQQGAAVAFRRHAHSIKSSAQSLGALRLADVARQLEIGGLALAQDEPAVLDRLDQEFELGVSLLRGLCRA